MHEAASVQRPGGYNINNSCERRNITISCPQPDAPTLFQLIILKIERLPGDSELSSDEQKLQMSPYPHFTPSGLY
ncbi:hypothetical protein K443DRAFT_286787 [Laccaria amethystina LaAM-08-1]|uniref:Uncharacterized protein n=1 Tax=Laccaria amethystina LaAM-08-1 TaxID=1095629 RepID=A0A0C9XM84_9AGAR|nr:hypothetical protein K443DRAFT_286787 [Laccaria amethystina LaAM-08-1]